MSTRAVTYKKMYTKVVHDPKLGLSRRESVKIYVRAHEIDVQHLESDDGRSLRGLHVRFPRCPRKDIFLKNVLSGSRMQAQEHRIVAGES